jgi:ppGpp synthetase/RelA/SpoT-type nucleotidyltranferase
MFRNRHGKRWYDRQVAEFRKMRKRYKKYASFLDNVLKRAGEKYASLAIVQVRAKTLPSFAEKAIRKLPKSEALNSFTSAKQWTEFFDPVNEFTDLCGARVITQTQHEADRICHFIRDNFTIDEMNSEDKLTELRPDQFGYLSVHYIVQVPDLENILDEPVDKGIKRLKAEIQVRTLLQHAWADVSHDSLYKNQFKVPGKWHRDMARLAAVLEAADKEFTQFVDNLHAFAGDYGAYMTKNQINEELSIIDTILVNEKDPKQIKNLTLRKVRIYKAMAEWKKVIDELSPYKNSEDPVILRELGNALCRAYRGSPSGRKYKQGQKYLGEALEIDENDAEAWANLAWSWEVRNIKEAQECYSQAYRLNSFDPYYLASFLEFEIANRRDFSDKSLLEPVLLAAIKTCRAHADVNINLPESLFTVGRLYMLLGDSYQSLSAYIEAVDLCISPDSGVPAEAIDQELDFLKRVEHIKDSLEGFEWIKRLLIVAKCAKLQTKRRPKELIKLADKKAVYKGPVVIVAGSCASDEEDRVLAYRNLLADALAGFHGEVISGGTTSGISGIVGSLSGLLEENDRSGFKTVAYLPSSVPIHCRVDDRYDLLFYSDALGFSPLEPLQMWVDLLSSGLNPSQIKLVGIGGGKIAAIEYRLALALGAKVGVLGDSRRAVEEILNDDRWRNHPSLVKLIPDPMTVRALLLSPSSRIGMNYIVKAAKASHNKNILNKISEIIGPAIKPNHRTILEKLHKVIGPAMQPWDKLIEPFQYSSIQQKLYAEAILRYEGYALRVIKDPGKIKLIEFSDKKRVRRMAEMEHGRWNLERIQTGWKRGLEKDIDKKISPYLIPWDELSEEVKESDVNYVKRWPEDFKEAGLEVYDLSEEE